MKKKNKIATLLAETMNKKINLELEIVPVLKMIAEDGVEWGSEEAKAGQIAEEIITDKMSMLSDEVIVESVAVALKEDFKISRYGIDVLMRFCARLKPFTCLYRV